MSSDATKSTGDRPADWIDAGNRATYAIIVALAANMALDAITKDDARVMLGAGLLVGGVTLIAEIRQNREE